MQTSKLTVVTWYGSSGSQADIAAMRLEEIVVSVLPGWQVNCSYLPLKLFWIYWIWEYHAYTRYIRKFLTNKGTAYFLAHPISQKMWSIVCFFFSYVVFSQILEFSTTHAWMILRFTIMQKLIHFSRTLFDEEIALFRICVRACVRAWVCVCVCVCDFTAIESGRNEEAPRRCLLYSFSLPIVTFQNQRVKIPTPTFEPGITRLNAYVKTLL